MILKMTNINIYGIRCIIKLNKTLNARYAKARSSLSRTTPGAPAAFSRTSPMRIAVSPHFRSDESTPSSCCASTIRTIPIPMLNVRAISDGAMPLPVACIQRNTGGISHDVTSITTWRSSRTTRGMLSGSPPPVMCAIARTRDPPGPLTSGSRDFT